jgi:HPt (histidine-containing phosphotransfer) domain-containing protein
MRQADGAHIGRCAKGITMISIEKMASEQGLDRDDVIELVEDFLQYTETQDLVALQEAFACNNREVLRERAHSIKGAALNLKLAPIADCAKKIESACDTGNLEEVPDLIHALVAYVKALPAELDEIRRG